METVLTRLTRTQVETLRARFPLAVKARAIIIRGSTVTFRVPDGAQIWDASPLHVARAITLSELHQGDPLKPGLITLGQRVVAVAKGGQHRDVRVLEDLEEPSDPCLKHDKGQDCTVHGPIETKPWSFPHGKRAQFVESNKEDIA